MTAKAGIGHDGADVAIKADASSLAANERKEKQQKRK
jgi:hypothetical protein